MEISIHRAPARRLRSRPERSGYLREAVNEAFAAIERVQRRMSVHDPASELSQVNREAARRPVTVSRELFTLLQRADQVARESNGAFDYTVAPLLARWRFLPAKFRRRTPGNWRDVRLLKGRRVSFQQPLVIDLGGIAKGYAVDEALGVLRTYGVRNAVVNAGGDLRVLGSQPVSVHLRHPTAPQSPAHRLDIADAALATSSPCFTERRHQGKGVSHLVNPINGSALTGGISATVRAKECWLADALTKVVINAPNQAELLLGRYEADAIMLTT